MILRAALLILFVLGQATLGQQDPGKPQSTVEVLRIFFFSDGFLADTGPRGPIASNQLGRLTDEARRAGVVIYSIDARGLVSGALDATGNVPLDPNGRLENANMREIAASQDALNALAADTAGVLSEIKTTSINSSTTRWRRPRATT